MEAFFPSEKWEDSLLSQQLLINSHPPRIVTEINNAHVRINKH